MNNSNGNPLMFIQTIKENVNNCSNQTYFDSRNKVKIETVSPPKERTNGVSDELLGKLKLITSAKEKGLKIICEVVLITQEIVVGEVIISDESYIACNDLSIGLDNILEINIQKVQNL